MGLKASVAWGCGRASRQRSYRPVARFQRQQADDLRGRTIRYHRKTGEVKYDRGDAINVR